MGKRGTIGEECNRYFIDEAWVSKCRLLVENAGALSAAGPARRKKEPGTIPRTAGGPEEGKWDRLWVRGRSRLLQINSCRDSFRSYLTLISRSNEFYNVPRPLLARIIIGPIGSLSLERLRTPSRILNHLEEANEKGFGHFFFFSIYMKERDYRNNIFDIFAIFLM